MAACSSASASATLPWAVYTTPRLLSDCRGLGARAGMQGERRGRGGAPEARCVQVWLPCPGPFTPGLGCRAAAGGGGRGGGPRGSSSSRRSSGPAPGAARCGWCLSQAAAARGARPQALGLGRGRSAAQVQAQPHLWEVGAYVQRRHIALSRLLQVVALLVDHAQIVVRLGALRAPEVGGEGRRKGRGLPGSQRWALPGRAARANCALLG
jgi:hypothetical protein